MIGGKEGKGEVEYRYALCAVARPFLLVIVTETHRVLDGPFSFCPQIGTVSKPTKAVLVSYKKRA